MDFALNEEDKMLRRTAREFLQAECPKRAVLTMEADGKGYSPQLWKKMGELGWLGLPFPGEYQGGDGKMVSLTVLVEEMGRALLPSPFIGSVVCCGLAILKAGTEDQRQQFLPRIAAGDIIFSLALTEPSATYHARGVEAQAVLDGNQYRLRGTKLFVSDADVADYLLCAARTSDTVAPEEGITLFVLSTKSQGVKVVPLTTIALDKQYEVDLQGVKVPRGGVLGYPNAGWPVIEASVLYGALADCAFMVGAGAEVLDMTVNYAKERVQFERPIGSFQAVQHMCADMLIDLDIARWLTYQAAWKLEQGDDATTEIAMAKAWVGEAYRRICTRGQQIHGGIGLMGDHTMQLYFRRAIPAELTFGAPTFWRNVVAKQVGI